MGKAIDIMEELELQEERSGVFTRLKSLFTREDQDYAEEDVVEEARNHTTTYRVHARSPYMVTVRRTVESFQDAIAAADGLKRGEQQVLNLNHCETVLREKIKDFMCGVNYAHEGTWEELGDNIYLLAPPHATVEVAPASPRMSAARN